MQRIFDARRTLSRSARPIKRPAAAAAAGASSSRPRITLSSYGGTPNKLRRKEKQEEQQQEDESLVCQVCHKKFESIREFSDHIKRDVNFLYTPVPYIRVEPISNNDRTTTHRVGVAYRLGPNGQNSISFKWLKQNVFDKQLHALYSTFNVNTNKFENGETSISLKEFKVKDRVFRNLFLYHLGKHQDTASSTIPIEPLPANFLVTWLGAPFHVAPQVFVNKIDALFKPTAAVPSTSSSSASSSNICIVKGVPRENGEGGARVYSSYQETDKPISLGNNLPVAVDLLTIEDAIEAVAHPSLSEQDRLASRHRLIVLAGGYARNESCDCRKCIGTAGFLDDTDPDRDVYIPPPLGRTSRMTYYDLRLTSFYTHEDKCPDGPEILARAGFYVYFDPDQQLTKLKCFWCGHTAAFDDKWGENVWKRHSDIAWGSCDFVNLNYPIPVQPYQWDLAKLSPPYNKDIDGPLLSPGNFTSPFLRWSMYVVAMEIEKKFLQHEVSDPVRMFRNFVVYLQELRGIDGDHDFSKEYVRWMSDNRKATRIDGVRGWEAAEVAEMDQLKNDLLAKYHDRTRLPTPWINLCTVQPPPMVPPPLSFLRDLSGTPKYNIVMGLVLKDPDSLAKDYEIEEEEAPDRLPPSYTAMQVFEATAEKKEIIRTLILKLLKQNADTPAELYTYLDFKDNDEPSLDLAGDMDDDDSGGDDDMDDDGGDNNNGYSAIGSIHISTDIPVPIPIPDIHISTDFSTNSPIPIPAIDAAAENNDTDVAFGTPPPHPDDEMNAFDGDSDSTSDDDDDDDLESSDDDVLQVEGGFFI